MTSYSDSGIISGQNSVWNLLKKLGEGDAGEVFLVESLIDQSLAILKRPQRSVFTGEVRRQAEQIRTEGRILKTLETIFSSLPGERVSAPLLVDQSKPGGESSDRFFIIITRAPGFDLSFLARVTRMGMLDPNEVDASPAQRAFLEEIAATGKLPERILLSALSAVFTTFAAIHEIASPDSAAETLSILWNDVKPDHIFWNPENNAFTIIDWGNGQLIEPNTPSRGLRHTSLEDRRQFLDEMSRFLAQVAPGLQARLEWPEKLPPAEDLNWIFESLRERVIALLAEENKTVAALRQEEISLAQPGLLADSTLEPLEELHHRLIALGELPDYKAALRLASGSIEILASTGEMDRVQQLCSWAARLPGASQTSWLLLAHLAQSAVQMPEAMRALMVEAVQAAAAGDWEGVLWGMLTAIQSNAEPDGWYDIVQQVRSQAGGEETNSIPPLLALRRLSLTLQSNCRQIEDRLARSPSEDGNQRLAAMSALLDALRRAVQNWIQVDPFPPYTSLAYSEVEELFSEIETYLPGGSAELQRLLDRPRAQVNTILEAWGRKEFITATHGLRRLLVLDPDRRRLVQTNQVLQAVPDWLLRIYHGPQSGEHLAEYVTALEYEGREMRSQVGPAVWLDGILDGLKALRQGAWPGDLFISHGVLLGDMPWLQKYVRSEVLSRLLNPNLPPPALPAISGARETRYGPEKELSFVEPLDAWMPEARGSSARVYLSLYLAGSGEQREAALKIMRMDKVDYSLPLFSEEVRVLSVMQDVPGVARLLECGFLRMGGEAARLPSDRDLTAIQALNGEALRIGPDSCIQFIDTLENRVKEDWTPYLLVEKRKRDDSLLLLCDAALNRGRFQPVSQLLFIAIQICDILHIAHQRNVVYRDHKILHYYWQPENNGVSLIDWNVARYHPEGLTPVDIHMDLVQFGARGLHHVLTGRTAPGALPMGPTRPEEIERAAQSYAAQWTYDDQRLSKEVRVILEQLLSGSYLSAADLREDLKRAYMNLMSEN